MAEDEGGLPESVLASNVRKLMRNRGIGGIGKLRAAMGQAGYKIGNSTLLRALQGGSGNRLESIEKLAAFFDVTSDQLLQPNLGADQEPEREDQPRAPGARFDALSEDEQRFIDNLREIQVDEDEWHRIMEDVATKAAKIRSLREKLLSPHGIRSTPARHAADAKKTEIARAALDVTEQLRQRSLFDPKTPREE